MSFDIEWCRVKYNEKEIKNKTKYLDLEVRVKKDCIMIFLSMTVRRKLEEDKSY